ncbi:MAG: hypothetical protein L7F78_20500, partial [Syntrophales bacterium LBB04]|nr:hypothetical protein [Syntrophales bacterium LBB04]
PGEKIHETLIGEDEGRYTIEYNECYVIRQNYATKETDMLAGNGGNPCPEGFTYDSKNNQELISIEALRELIDKISDDYAIETTRWSMDDVPQ